MEKLVRLSQCFNLDPKQITPIEKIELIYIYNKISKELGTEDIDLIAIELKRKHDELNTRSKKKRLYRVYDYYWTRTVTTSSQYDTDTMRPPDRSSYDILGYN